MATPDRAALRRATVEAHQVVAMHLTPLMAAPDADDLMTKVDTLAHAMAHEMLADLLDTDAPADDQTNEATP